MCGCPDQHASRPCSEQHKYALEPMTRPSGPYQPLELVDFDPDELVHPPIAPQVEQLARQLHRPACHPQTKNAPVWLERRKRESAHFIVCHCAVWQLEV